MDEPLKRRLVGATVILSLVVIFVPMLVDEEPLQPEQLSESNLPLLPDEKLETREYHTEPLAIAGALHPGAEPVAERPANLPAAEETASVTTGEDMAAESADQVPTDPEPLSASEDSATSAAAQTPQPDTLAEQGAGDLQAWVVQVASFTNPKFAQSLVTELRDKGFAAFMEDVHSGGRIWYRVVVGPEVEKQRTRELQNAIVKSTGDERLRGAIKTYP